MPRKHLILACTLLFLILSRVASAETEREAIVNHTQNATWAYHTENDFIVQGERWYISLINTMALSKVYSLGPINNGQASWWSVGTGVATFDSAVSNISFAQYLDISASDTFWDEGLKLNITNSQIHSDRQKLQGRTVRIKWYFFKAPNGSWYIINAPGYGTTLEVRRFAEKNGQYDWPAVDVSGVNATFIPSQSGNGMTISFTFAGFLSFPLACGDANCSFTYTQGAYTPNGITSVLDHGMTTVFGKDGAVTAFTGETGMSTGIYVTTNPAPCYPRVGGGAFSVNGLYKGTTGNNAWENCSPSQALNYDGHPGYDYVAGLGTEVRAAAGGKVGMLDTSTNTTDICLPKGISEGCAAWGYIGIDHGNGYVTQYGHLSQIYVVAGQTVTEGQLIGLSGQTSPTNKPVGPHLHFEVLKVVPAGSSCSHGYCVVEPYKWEGNGADPLATVTGISNDVRLWK